jgi:hypothetical protein
VLAGGSREEANINMHAVPALRLTVEARVKQDSSAASSELNSEFSLDDTTSPISLDLPHSIFGLAIPNEGIRPNYDEQSGAVEFTGVAPGHYQLTQGDPPRIAYLDAAASQQVDPNLGKHTVGLSGTLRSSSGAALPEKVTLSLGLLEATYRPEPTFVEISNGQFTLHSIPQGNWELTASTPEKQLSITSVSLGGHSHPGNQITVSDKPVKIVVTVSLSETRIEGFAHKGVKGQSGVMVLLVPKDLAAFPALARRDQSDSDGSFALRDVVPGHYTLVAIENGWDLDWERPEVIGRYLPDGIPVTVTETSDKLVRLSQPVPVQSP